LQTLQTLQILQICLISPQDVLDRAQISVIRHNDAHFVSRLHRLVLGKVIRRKRRPLVGVNFRSGDDQHKLSLAVEKAAQIPQDAQLVISAHNVVEREGREYKIVAPGRQRA
jgi:hypothetical protein